MKTNTKKTSREERYKLLLSPFEEYVPGLRPSNSDAYLTLLATRMRAAGWGEEGTLMTIVDQSPFELDEAHVKDIVHMAFAVPADAPSPQLNSTQNTASAMAEFFDRRYQLRRNEVLGVVEYLECKRFHNNWRVVDDVVINSMVVNAREEGIDLWDRDVHRYLNSDRVCPYNPFRTFCSSLPKWDGRPRLDKFLHRVPVDDEQWYPLERIWFLGMVALWAQMNRRKGNELMLILVGEQGVGKSTFCRSILPPELESYYQENFALNDRRKAMLMLTRYGLINFDEMNRLTDRQQPVLKNMLQLPLVDEFKPYASSSTRQPRYASLTGTSNEMSIIRDLTGSRRYLCAKVTGPIDIRTPINYPQLYAEALQAVRDGSRYWLSEDEEAALTERNMRFTCMPVNAEYFDNHFDIVPLGTEGGEWLYASDIHRMLHPTQHKPMTHRERVDFRAYMESRHAVTRRASGGIQYFVRRK